MEIIILRIQELEYAMKPDNINILINVFLKIEILLMIIFLKKHYVMRNLKMFSIKKEEEDIGYGSHILFIRIYYS
jgi:hypothetical protein